MHILHLNHTKFLYNELEDVDEGNLFGEVAIHSDKKGPGGNLPRGPFALGCCPPGIGSAS